MDKKTRPLHTLPTRDLLQIEWHTQTGDEGLKKNISWNGILKKKAGIAIFILDKIDFKTKIITQDKEGPSSPIFGYLSEQIQNTTSKGYLNPFVHCCIVFNRQDMEVTWCPSTDEWVKKRWYIYTMECYSAIKNKNEILPSAATWMDLEGVVLSGVSQTEKDKCHMISLTSRI